MRRRRTEEIELGSVARVEVELAPGEYVARRGTEGVVTHFRVATEPIQVAMH